MLKAFSRQKTEPKPVGIYGVQLSFLLPQYVQGDGVNIKIMKNLK